MKISDFDVLASSNEFGENITLNSSEEIDEVDLSVIESDATRISFRVENSGELIGNIVLTLSGPSTISYEIMDAEFYDKDLIEFEADIDNFEDFVTEGLLLTDGYTEVEFKTTYAPAYQPSM